VQEIKRPVNSIFIVCKRKEHEAVHRIRFGAAKALLLGLFFQFPISGQSWVQVSPIGTLPPARYYHSTVHDSITNRLIVFGGIGNTGMLSDI
jgi:hypothetical protein